MKTYVIMLSKVFPKGHRREGDQTYFKEKLLSGEKIHTIRTNFPLWEKRIKEVQEGNAYISVRQWEGKPYRSKQIEIARLTKDNGVGIEVLWLKPISQRDWTLAAYPKLDSHDGLSREDWLSWFRLAPVGQALPIIHFTPFRYNSNENI